jgi:hypothetical protein
LASWGNNTAWASLQNAYDDQDTATTVSWFNKPIEVMMNVDAPALKDISNAKNAYFSREELVSLRSGWDSLSSFAATKGGFVGADHGTMNIGTFVYEALGERFVSQLGQENYALPGYWDFGQTDQRWDYYRTRAEGNNTLVLIPSADGGQDVTQTATVTSSTLTSESSPRAVIDMTSVYARQASTLLRGLRMFVANAQDGKVAKGLLVQDEITMNTAGSIFWFAHTKATITQGADKTRATLTLNGKVIEARLTSPPGAILQVMDAVGGPNSPIYTPAISTDPVPASNTSFKKIFVELTGKVGTKQTIRVQFAPYSSTGAVPSTAVRQSLSKW